MSTKQQDPYESLDHRGDWRSYHEGAWVGHGMPKSCFIEGSLDSTPNINHNQVNNGVNTFSCNNTMNDSFINTLSQQVTSPFHNQSPTSGVQRIYGFVSSGRMPGRHVPPRDFPHHQLTDPNLVCSPIYDQPSPQRLFLTTTHQLRVEGPQRLGVFEQNYAQQLTGEEDSKIPQQVVNTGHQCCKLASPSLQPKNDLVIPRHHNLPGNQRHMNQNHLFSENICHHPSPSDVLELRPNQRGQDPILKNDCSGSQPFSKTIIGEKKTQSCNTQPNMIQNCQDYQDIAQPSTHGFNNNPQNVVDKGDDDDNKLDIEFSEVGLATNAFWPKPGDLLILATERKGCRWPAFDGHLEIYVDNDYFTKSSVALQWNYDFQDGDLLLRFGEFDRHWRWRPNDKILVFLRDHGTFFLIARQQAQELHPLDFRFVDPHQRPIHSIQYHFQPQMGDLVLRRSRNDSYLWETQWWHPGGDSHLLSKHCKQPTYHQGPHPKYKWTFHWLRKGFQFYGNDILLRVGYESAEDNVHNYCACEIYFLGENGLWTFQGRDDYSFGPSNYSV